MSVFQWFVIAFFVAGIGGPVVNRLFGRLPGAGLLGGGFAAFAWLLIGSALLAGLIGLLAFVIALLSGLGRTSGWSSGSSGGGWSSGGGFSSGGSGGFSGGGGSSGGGGASGSW